MFPYEPFERGALDEILHLALDDRYFAHPDETGALTVALAENKKAIADRSERLRRLAKLLAQRDDAREMEDEYDEIRKQVTQLEAEVERISSALDIARGSVSPSEHLERVRDLRNSLYDPDQTTRQAARLRVKNAIQALGIEVVCRIDREDGERQFGVFLKGGVLALAFNVEGKLILKQDEVDFVEAVFQDKTPEELVARTMQHVNWNGSGTGDVDENWLLTYIRRRHATPITQT